MPDITFIHPNGSEQGFEAPEGISLMQAATSYGVAGIEADCGGAAICATCHVYVDEAWADRLPAPDAGELDTLDCTSSERLPNSRLACQIKLTAALQGLVVRVAPSQR